MEIHAATKPTRLPRFRRASEPRAFRLTDSDIEMVRQLARHRFLRSTHVAALVGRSLDAVNGRLSGLYHHGYIDRPRAQLDYHPTGGSNFFVYALANRGARLLIEHDGIERAYVDWSRKNREAGRPFIEHQLEVVDFRVALINAVRERSDIRLILPEAIIANMPKSPRTTRGGRSPFAMKTKLTQKGVRHEVELVPDFAFSLEFRSDERHNFLVEIDRGTMPVSRRDFSQTSFERKMRCYLSARSAKKHETQFGWRNFSVLTVTKDGQRAKSMRAALKQLEGGRTIPPSFFYFGTRNNIGLHDPTKPMWLDASGRAAALLKHFDAKAT